MADLVWRWNGSTWVEDTGTGGAVPFHTHTIDQVTGLQAAIDAVTGGTVVASIHPTDPNVTRLTWT